MIPSGMMRTRVQLRHAVLSADSVGQQTVSYSAYATMVCHVESANRRDAEFAGGPGANETVVIHTPWVSGVRVGDSVLLYDVDTFTAFDVQRVDDDRTRHQRLRIELLAVQEVS